MCFATTRSLLVIPDGDSGRFSCVDTQKRTVGDRTMRPPESRAPLPCAPMDEAASVEHTYRAVLTPLRSGKARPHWRTDALVLAVIAVAIRLPAFFATRSLVFDD